VLGAVLPTVKLLADHVRRAMKPPAED